MSPFTKNFFAKIKLLVERYNMTSSLITKKRIAKAFKDLLKVGTLIKFQLLTSWKLLVLEDKHFTIIF